MKEPRVRAEGARDGHGSGGEADPRVGLLHPASRTAGDAVRPVLGERPQGATLRSRRPPFARLTKQYP